MWIYAYIFDIWARVKSDHITVLDAEVVADHPVDAGASVIKLLIGKNNQNCVFPLLATNQDGIAAEELQGVHSRLGQGDNTVIIVDGIGDPETVSVA